MMVVVLFLGGIQIMGLGIIGEYIGRIFLEAKRRPIYLLQKTYGFEDSTVLRNPEDADPRQ
jgi:glycosyltransferase involved in cell wall biosynthesis